jgi:dual specificity phosphatase 12
MCEEIIRNLYVGNIHAARSFEGSIISMVPLHEIGNNQERDMMNLHIPDDERYNIRIHFRDTNTFIYERLRRGKKVMVHCRAGISRNVTILIAYLMRAYLIDVDDAYAMMLKVHPNACPNPGFLQCLYAYNTYIDKLRKRNQ